MSHYSNITGLTDALTVSNTLSGGYLGYGFPIVLWIAIFGYSLNVYGRAHSVVGASFITLIILLLENMVGLVPYWTLIADLILFAIGLIMLMLERRTFG